MNPANLDYNRYKELISEHILDFLPKVDPKSNTVYEAMKYSLTAGGKRIRPVLLLAACEFSGGEAASALPYACAIEYIHTYSLIHDDLPAMDDDELRRGVPTNHKVFGEAMAILAGDALLTSAFEAIHREMLTCLGNTEQLNRRIRAAHEIAKGAGCQGMIAGQVADIEAENKLCSKEMLDYIHINKTAALILSAVKAGAYLGGADEKTRCSLSAYAENLGLAFQISDDILDVTGNEMKLGKKIGVDQERHKSTYPVLYGLDESKKRLQKLTDAAIESISSYDNADFFISIANKLAIRCD